MQFSGNVGMTVGYAYRWSKSWLRPCTYNVGVLKNSLKLCLCDPDRIGIWICWFLRREENLRTGRKTSRSKERTNDKLNPHMASMPGFKPGPQRWEAGAITNVPLLLEIICFGRHCISISRNLLEIKIPSNLVFK